MTLETEMGKRFRPNPRLLEILVGSNLYGSQDACIRELLQNASDAIQLRNAFGDGNGGRITVSYSVSGGWFEVSDDGIGMDQTTIEKSFLEIGEDKLKVLGITEPTSQIGYFGIGVLSIFLLADSFEVYTKSTDKPALRFVVSGLYDDVNFTPVDQHQPGTRIRVFPRDAATFSLDSLPNSVRSYARHVPGVTLHSLDGNNVEPLTDTWSTDRLHSVRDITGISTIRSGRIGFLPVLRENAGTLETQFTICNSGFLVEHTADDLIPTATLGVAGEVDLEPARLTMGMSRERVQRDDAWVVLGQDLQRFTIDIALDELTTGDLRPLPEPDSEVVKRNILLWYHFLPPEPPFSELYDTLDRRVYETVPFSQPDRAPITLEQLCAVGPPNDKIYYRHIGARSHVTQRIDDDGLSVRFQQEIRNSVRISALRAKGFGIIDLDQLQVNLKSTDTVQTQLLQESPLVQRCLRKRGVELVNITDAPDTDMDMTSIEKLPILRSALTIAGGLRFVEVPDSRRRIITDQGGNRYVNLRSPTVQQLLELIPAATSNPLRNKLMEAYLKLEDYKLSDAREILIELLEADNLEMLARSEMAPLTKRHLHTLIAEVLRDLTS